MESVDMRSLFIKVQHVFIRSYHSMSWTLCFHWVQSDGHACCMTPPQLVMSRKVTDRFEIRLSEASKLDSMLSAYLSASYRTSNVSILSKNWLCYDERTDCKCYIKAFVSVHVLTSHNTLNHLLWRLRPTRKEELQNEGKKCTKRHSWVKFYI